MLFNFTEINFLSNISPVQTGFIFHFSIINCFYLCRMENDIEIGWNAILIRLEKQFGMPVQLEGVLFLIGVQELGQGFREFKKSEKVDLMHIAICRLLSNWGYYELEGLDKDGWPHYKIISKLPPLHGDQQNDLLKEAIVEYFKEI